MAPQISSQTASSHDYVMPFSTPQSIRSMNDALFLNQKISPIGLGIPQHFARKRHKRILRDNMAGAMTKPAIRRLARRGGIKRIKLDIYAEIRKAVRDRLTLVRHATSILELSRRKTVTALDIVYVLKYLNAPMYGFGAIEKGGNIPDHRAAYQAKKRRMATTLLRSRLELEMRRPRGHVGDISISSIIGGRYLEGSELEETEE